MVKPSQSSFPDVPDEATICSWSIWISRRLEHTIALELIADIAIQLDDCCRQVRSVGAKSKADRLLTVPSAKSELYCSSPVCEKLPEPRYIRHEAEAVTRPGSPHLASYFFLRAASTTPYTAASTTGSCSAGISRMRACKSNSSIFWA